MSIDYVAIGGTPWDEPCVQVSKTEPYIDDMRAECKRFIECIRQHCGEEPDGAHLMVKSFPHDYGTYYEVICKFYEDDNAAVDYAFHVESNAPSKWDGDGAVRWYNPSDRNIGACVAKAVSQAVSFKTIAGISQISLEFGLAWYWIKDESNDSPPDEQLMRHMVAECSIQLEEQYGIYIYNHGILRRAAALNKIQFEDGQGFEPIRLQGE